MKNILFWISVVIFSVYFAMSIAFQVLVFRYMVLDNELDALILETLKRLPK
jgi:hypothetical protein